MLACLTSTSRPSQFACPPATQPRPAYLGFCILPNGARVEQHDVSAIGDVCLLIPRLAQHRQHHLAVIHVHLAAAGDSKLMLKGE